MQINTTPSGEPVYVGGYKEPLRAYPKGYGYLGTLSYNEDKTKIQCHLCGELFGVLAPHLVAAHGMSAVDYRQEIQLGKTTGLVSEVQRIRLTQMNAGKKLPNLTPIVKGTTNVWAKGKKRKWSLEHRNKRGTCPDQLINVIVKLAKSLGKTPTVEEFKALYKGRYLDAIKDTYGSWNNALKMAGYAPNEYHQYTREELINALKAWTEVHGRIPTKSELNSEKALPSYYIYWKAFGGLPQAVKEAKIKYTHD